MEPEPDPLCVPGTCTRSSLNTHKEAPILILNQNAEVKHSFRNVVRTTRAACQTTPDHTANDCGDTRTDRLFLDFLEFKIEEEYNGNVVTLKMSGVSKQIV
eukprot:m.49477 g.49477  ORF g.49477 m.49477 type:complete len:101 (+) comp21028_c0_seq2:307-609(+)